MEDCVTLVKFNFEELLLVKANGDLRHRYWVYDTSSMFCLLFTKLLTIDKTDDSAENKNKRPICA